MTGLDMPRGKEHSLQVLNLALTIADAAVRSDIELYARAFEHPDGHVAYDLTRPADDDSCRAEMVATAVRAARYIHLRGDVFQSWRMVRQIDNLNIVHFIDREVGA